MNKEINVISLFDGHSGGQIALKELGIPVNKYFSSEIDKYPMKATKSIFPDTIQLGTIIMLRLYLLGSESNRKRIEEGYFTSKRTKKLIKLVRELENTRIDLAMAGSPCQGFSFAGKQLNFNDPRSKLFFDFIAILNFFQKRNPNIKFLLENVIMKKQYQKIINDHIGIMPCRINSKLVSAQNRDRLYWTNIRTRKDGLFGEFTTDIPQPKDLGIMLKDILQPESEVDQKYYIKNPKIDLKGLDINKKSPTQRASTGNCTDNKHNYQIIKLDKKGNKKVDQNKAGCLTGGGHSGGHSGGNHSDMDIICVTMVGRKINEHGKRDDYNNGIKAVQRLEPKTDGKSNCLTCVQKDNLILVDFSRRNEGIRYYKEKAPTLNARDYKEPRCVTDGYRLRRLTPYECGKLQTIPEDILQIMLNCGISDTRLYQMFGNGWTNAVIVHILSFWK